MTKLIEYAGGHLEVRFAPYIFTKAQIFIIPDGHRATKCGLTHDQLKELIEALQDIEVDMRPRAEAKRTAEAMAKDLHDKGWTCKRFSDAMHPTGPVVTSTVIGDIAEELSRLDEGAGQ